MHDITSETGRFEQFELGTRGHTLSRGRLPDELIPNAQEFEQWWELHPEEHATIVMHGREVAIPRWQQAYGADYRFTGQVSRAQPMTAPMEAILTWFRQAIDARLNGLLLNWYDGSAKHYIGAHRDSTHGLMEGSPIVTLSFGQERIFRVRPWKGKGFYDHELFEGDVLIIPWATNLAWTHEVPDFARYDGRRISVTARAFRHAG